MNNGSNIADAIWTLRTAADLNIREIAEEMVKCSNGLLTIAEAEIMIRQYRMEETMPLPPTLEEFKLVDPTWLLYGG